MDTKKFDDYAVTYQQHHIDAIASSGEGTDYFHDYKIACLKRLGLSSGKRVLDYGCGVGNLVERLANSCDVSGFDPSVKSLEICRARVANASLYEHAELIPSDSYDGAVLSCVLHHIEPQKRDLAMADVFRSLKIGGMVVIFEHNPWNPLTRRVVKLCSFDDDAILLSPKENRDLLERAGFVLVKTKFIVFFPRIFSAFRWLEPYLGWCPLGAQVMTIGVKK